MVGCARRFDPATAATAAAPGSVRAPLRSSEVPHVGAIIAANPDPIERNVAFNAAYQQLARGIQGVLGRAPGTLPNWFAVGAYASPQVGRSMIAADRTLEAIELLRSEDRPSRDRVFDEMGLEGTCRRVAAPLAKALDVPVSSHNATAIAVFVSMLAATDRATSTQALLDPRLAIAVAYRIHSLLRSADGLAGNTVAALKSLFRIGDKDVVLDRLASLCRTYKSLLADGNRAIFSDIGGSAAAFLRFREQRGASSPADVLANLNLPESSPAGSRRVFDRALEHAFDRPPLTDLSGWAAPGAGNDLVRAAFALYTLAGQMSDVDRKNAYISFANNLIARREQFETVQPAFTETRDGEMDRGRVLAALTPLVQVPFDDFTWRFSTFARKQPARDHNILTAHSSEYDWSKFEDRWPAILDAFTTAYRHRDDLWRFANTRLT